jgi:phosphotransferase system  glucose/maltose/N-acetylglucosamine-specific IIC component
MTDQGAEDYGIEQNNEQGPGWFLKISYVVIIAFMFVYWFSYKNYKSTYDLEIEKKQQKVEEIDKEKAETTEKAETAEETK